MISPQSSRSLKLTVAKFVALFFLAAPCSIPAATVTWTGNGTDSNWKTADNWTTADYPGQALTTDDAVISLDGANVTLSGGLPNRLGSLWVANTNAAHNTALTITSGTVTIGVSGVSNPNLKVGGIGTNTLTIASSGIVNVLVGGGRFVTVGDRNKAGPGVLHLDGGSFTSAAPVRMAGTSANSALRISDAATATFNGGLGIDSNNGSSQGNLILDGSQFTATAASFTSDFTTTNASVYGISFFADNMGLGSLAVAGNMTLQNGGATDATNLSVDLTGFSYGLNTAYTLFSYGGDLVGAFTAVNVIGLSGGHTAQIDYGDGSNDLITLMVVPEPSTWALLVGTLAVMAVFRRRRRA